MKSAYPLEVTHFLCYTKCKQCFFPISCEMALLYLYLFSGYDIR